MIPFRLGLVFRIETPPSFVPHHFVVIGRENPNQGPWLAVNWTTDEWRAEDTCILEAKDHPKITGKSFVTYGDALMLDEKAQDRMEQLIGRYVFFVPPDITGPVLRRIIEGGKDSGALRRKFKSWLK